FEADEVIQCNAITRRAQFFQLFDQRRIRPDGLQDFQDNAFTRKGLAVVAENQIAIEIYKSQVLANDFVEADLHESIHDDLGGSLISIRERSGVLITIAKEKLVAELRHISAENGLPADENSLHSNLLIGGSLSNRRKNNDAYANFRGIRLV